MKSSVKRIALILLGSAILSFGLYNVHAMSGVTEGGVLGLTLFLNHWLKISPAITGFILNAICYLIGFKALGLGFVKYSAAAGLGFSGFYALFEQFEPVWPELAGQPIVAAISGAIFVGVGVGLCVACGGAPSGDDALAMAICKEKDIDIRWVYLISDISVLALSATYLDLKRVLLSLGSVVLSGQIVGYVKKIIRIN